MANKSAQSINREGLRQDNLPKRLEFILLGERGNKLVYKGFLSTCPLVYACFGEHDNPLEFFLTVNLKTKKIKVTPKL